MRLSGSTLLALFALHTVAAVNYTKHTACFDLASVLPNQVFFPNATTYDASIASYPFIQLRLHPNCIVRPKSTHDVSITLRTLRRHNGTQFAIKGGGHNANAGFNNINNGVTIDMQSLKGVQVARGDKVVRLEAGALSQDAYDAAETRNLTVMIGRIGVVGAAGFLTGGVLDISILRLNFADTLFTRRSFILISSAWLGLRRDCEFRGRPRKWPDRQC
jgi:hypothetical protein